MPLTADGPWDLPIRGYEVLQITFAFPLDIVAYADGGDSCTIRLEGSFDFTDAGQPAHTLNAAGERWQDLTAVLGLRHDRIKAANASETGQLLVQFESGAQLEAAALERYESWAVSGPGFQLIALPGGGVAVFSDAGTDTAS